MNKRAADEMGLPVYQVNSNFHAFTHKIGEQKVGYFALWSCILALEKAIGKYYISSSDEYEEIKKFSWYDKDFDMAGCNESYLVPLLSTENLELIIDGCQYRRTEKTENIADWAIAQKYLNVCVQSEDGTNCSVCSKCMRTLIPLEAMGKIDAFAGVFDIEKFHKHAFYNKCYFKVNTKGINFADDIVQYCKKKEYWMPPYFVSQLCVFSARVLRKLKRILKA